MKTETINLKLTKNIGNYQSVALGGEWSVEGEDLTAAMIAAKEQLDKAFAAMYAPQQPQQQPQAEQEQTPEQHQDKREKVEFGTPLLKRICERAQAGVPMETIEQYYILSDEARKCVEIAIKIK